MPHKRNPVLSENLSGLARVVRSHALTALENVTLWLERDISHSSAERVIGPDSTILIDFMLNRFASIVAQLVVYPKQMEKNLNLTNGIFFSQAIMLQLVKKGLSRENAYEVVQKSALRAWDEDKDFKTIIAKDTKVKNHLSKKEIEESCNIKNYLKHMDDIFLRVFGKKG